MTSISEKRQKIYAELKKFAELVAGSEADLDTQLADASAAFLATTGCETTE